MPTRINATTVGLAVLRPLLPSLSVDGTIPRQTSHVQMRLAITRAVSGLSRATSHSANSRRPLSPAGIVGPEPLERMETTPRATRSPGFEASPREYTGLLEMR